MKLTQRSNTNSLKWNNNKYYRIGKLGCGKYSFGKRVTKQQAMRSLRASGIPPHVLVYGTTEGRIVPMYTSLRHKMDLRSLEIEINVLQELNSHLWNSLDRIAVGEPEDPATYANSSLWKAYSMQNDESVI